MTSFLSITPSDLEVSKFHSYLLGAVIPRPIGFASTVDKKGHVNLSPFSFFNCFGSNPPLLIFSPSRRVRDNTIKHTLENIREVPEVVIGIVNYSMVEQMSLSSTEYPKDINEFVKGGFTELASDIITPPRVLECPVSFECKVQQVIETGQEGGAANLILCRIVKMHIDKKILDSEGQIDPLKLDPVARLGGNLYSRFNEDSVFEVKKPIKELGIGVDNIPEMFLNSGLLSKNELGKLGNIEKIPTKEEIVNWNQYLDYKEKLANLSPESLLREKINFAREQLNNNRIDTAWKILMFPNNH